MPDRQPLAANDAAALTRRILITILAGRRTPHLRLRDRAARSEPARNRTRSTGRPARS